MLHRFSRSPEFPVENILQRPAIRWATHEAITRLAALEALQHDGRVSDLTPLIFEAPEHHDVPFRQLELRCDEGVKLSQHTLSESSPGLGLEQGPLMLNPLRFSCTRSSTPMSSQLDILFKISSRAIFITPHSAFTTWS